MTEIVVIGGGPAGLAAAVAALDRGASVTLIESSDELGGQFWRHLPSTRTASNEQTLHHEWATFSRLRTRVLESERCTTLRSAHVWSAERVDGRPGTVHVLVGAADGDGRRRIRLDPDAIIVATGAYDRALPFPGWDLPGVFTAGAAQAMAKGERIALGRRVLVAGAGPFLLPVAASLSQAGSEVVAVLEASRPGRLARGWLPRPWQLIGAAKKSVELGGYVAGQLSHRTPYRTGRAVVAAHGVDRVESVTVAAIDADWAPIAGSDERITVDAVCVAHGFTPRTELAIALGTTLDRSGFVTVSTRQESSVAGVFAVGEITGIGGVDLALAEGGVAGHCAAGGEPTDTEIRPSVRRRTTYARFAARIDAAHGIGARWQEWLTDDTVVCRCEAVPYGRLCTAAAQTGSDAPVSLKLTSRAGLGICQGRVCGRTVDELIARQSGADARPPGGSALDRRPIALPIRLGELAEAGGPGRPETPQTESVKGQS